MENKEFKFNILFASVIITANLATAVLGGRTINITFLSQSRSILCGLIPFCFSFMLIDIYTNQYGFENSKKLIKIILLNKVFFALILFFIVMIPPTQMSADEIYYQTLAHGIIRALCAGTVATLVAFYINCHIFSRLLFRFNGKYLWLRCVVATASGEFIYSIISNTIFFLHKFNVSQIIQLTFNNFGFKFMFEVFTLPLTYLLAYLLAKYEVSQVIEYKNFKPKHLESDINISTT